MEWDIPNKNVRKCISCPIAKACCKRLKKITSREITDVGELMCSDISHAKSISYGGSKFWLLIVDCFTKMKWSFFIKHKDDQYKIITNFIKKFELETNKN